MPYVDIGQKTNTVGHCRTCEFQWVIAEGTKGKRGNHHHTYNGRVCPFCRSNDIRYEQEDNR